MKRPPLILALALAAVRPVVAQVSDNPVLRSARERLSQLNDAFFKEGDFLIVVKNAELLTETGPHDEEAWSNLSWMYQNIERPDLQWLACRRWATLNPSFVDGPYYEAQMFFFKRAYARVPALLEPVIARKPSPSPNTFRMLANSYSRLGYTADAVRVWDAYLRAHPEDGQAKANRQRAAARLKG